MNKHVEIPRTVSSEEFERDLKSYTSNPSPSPLFISGRNEVDYVLLEASEYARLTAAHERKRSREVEDHSELIDALEQTLKEWEDVEATDYPVIGSQ